MPILLLVFAAMYFVLAVRKFELTKAYNWHISRFSILLNEKDDEIEALSDELNDLHDFNDALLSRLLSKDKDAKNLRMVRQEAERA